MNMQPSTGSAMETPAEESMQPWQAPTATIYSIEATQTGAFAFHFDGNVCAS